MEHKEFGDVRREYELNRLDDLALPDDPFVLFVAWLEMARTSGSPDPTAMILSTVDPEGTPSSRVVLLKEIDRNRLIFFTSYRSRKAREIRNNPKVAAHFFWPELERQIKISGEAQVLEDKDSDHYFSSRPFESKVAAWASPQSEVVPGREFLENEYRKYLEKFRTSGDVPRPEHWGGLYITPKRMEFWQGGTYRLHDRIEYSLKAEQWSRVRLAP